MKIFLLCASLCIFIACGGSDPDRRPVVASLTLGPESAHQDDGMGALALTLSGDYRAPQGDVRTIRVAIGSWTEDLVLEPGPDPTKGHFLVKVPVKTANLGDIPVQVQLIDGLGCASAPFLKTFTVAAGPALAYTSPQSLPAGSPARSLEVYGSGFTATAVARLNGSPRPTTMESPTRLRMDLTAGDLTLPGTAWVTVVDPTTGGTASAPRPFSVGTHTTQIVPILSRDLVLDSLRQTLYATVPGNASNYAGSVVAIDPATGAIIASVSTGDDPNRLAIADDGSFLYVGLDGRRAIQRYALPSLAPDATILLGSDSDLGPLVALDIQVAPGAPRTFAVSYRAQLYEGSAGIIDVFDDTLLRCSTGRTFERFDSFQWGAGGNEIYAVDGETTGHGIALMTVANGISIRSIISGVAKWASEPHFDVRSGWIYLDSGKVIDPGKGAPVGGFYLESMIYPRMALDPGHGLAYFISPSSVANPGGYAFALRSFSLSHFTIEGSLTEFCVQTRTETGVSTPAPGRLLRWGSNGLAWGGGGNNWGIVAGAFPTPVYLLSGPFVTGN